MTESDLHTSRRGGSLAYLPALDGLRGIAVIAVLLFHAQFSWMRGGFLGVSAFFTLSGFLITTLLLLEAKGTGEIVLHHFWARRIRRLMPGAFLALGLIILFGAFAASTVQRQNLHADVLSTLAYGANWRFIFHHQSYAEVFSGTPSPVLHFWSLAIEEQFYLVFPLLVGSLLWLGRGKTRVLTIGLSVLTVASVLATRLLLDTTNGLNRVYYGTDTRAAELLIGALLALVLFHRKSVPHGAKRVAYAVGGCGSFVVLLVLWSRTTQNERWLYEGGLALHAVLTAIVLAECALAGPLAALLSVRPLRWLGRISYGVYLFHWPVFLWLGPGQHGLQNLSRTELFLVRFAVTLAIASLSFYLVERPIRTGKRLTRRLPATWPRVAAPVAAAGLVVAVVAVPRPSSTSSVVLKPISSGPPPVPKVDVRQPELTTPIAKRAVANSTTTSSTPQVMYHRALTSPRPLRVLVVGDSVGESLGRGLELWGIHSGRAQVWNVAKPYCSLARFAPRIAGINTVGPQGPSCDGWDRDWTNDVARFDPDVTVVLYTVWEMVKRKPPGASDFISLGDPRYDSWQLGEYEHAADVLSARGGKVVWLTVPCVRGNAFNSQTLQNSLIPYLNAHQVHGVEKARPSAVRVVDLDSELCPGGHFRASYGGVADARPDGAHFSDPGAVAVANWLMGKILAN